MYVSIHGAPLSRKYPLGVERVKYYIIIIIITYTALFP